MTVADITTTSYRIGRVRIDPTRVRGDGGAINPALVLSVSAELEPQPAERQLALTELRVELSIAGGPASAEARLGEPVRVRHVGGPQGIWATNPAATRDYDAEVRFPLNSAHLWLLESGAARQDRAIHLFVRVEAEAALVREEHQNVLGVSSGSAVELVPLTWIRVGDVTVPVPRSEWAEQILPAVGLNTMRLVACRLPRSGGSLGNDLTTWFDQARLKFDAGDYRGAIERARDVRNAVEQHLHSSRAAPVALKVETARGLPKHAPTTEFLDGVWRALADVTNEAHHPDRAARSMDWIFPGIDSVLRTVEAKP